MDNNKLYFYLNYYAMLERIPMNTTSLQKHFKSEYENFFAKNDLVVSGNFSFSRGTMWIGHRSQHLRIKSKLPTKLYVWISKNTTWEIAIKNTIVYDFSLNLFKEEKFSDIHKQYKEIIALIKDFLQKKNIEFGIDISILTESPRGLGLWFSGTLWAVLSAWLHTFIGELSKDLIENYQQFQQSDVFKNIFSFWQKIDFVARHKNLWINSIYSLLKSDFPYIFYSEKFDTSIDIDHIKELNYQKFPLDKILEWNYLKELPLDLAIVFTWQKQKTDVIENSIIHDKEKCDELSYFIERDLLWECKFSKKTNFHKFIKEDSIYEQISDTASIMWIKTVFLLKKIYTQGFDVNNINDFIDQINVLRNMLSLVEKQENFAEDVIYAFKNNQSDKTAKMWIKPIYSGKNWWWYMIVMKEWENRNVFEKTVNDLKKIYPNISLVYASWIDSSDSDWIILNQHISHGLFSDYVNKNKVFLKTNYWDNKIWDYNEVIGSCKEWLLLDMIKNKIYLDGIKLSSKDICSQAATANILSKLLDNIWKDISNKDFEVSSYSKNKNEMLWKIVLPLISFLEKQSWYNFPLICKGSIYDFYLKLNPTTIKISIINNI